MAKTTSSTSFSTGKVKKTKKTEMESAFDQADAEYSPVTGDSFATSRVVKPKPRDWSKHQQAIFKACANSKGSLIVKALAGTGKTTTVVEAISHLTGKILLCAFNKRIADELVGRVADGSAEVMTLHGLGFRLVGRSFPGCDVNNMRGLALAEIALNKVGGPKSKNYHWMVKDSADICKQIIPFVTTQPGAEGYNEAVDQVLNVARGYGHLDRLDERYAEVTGEAILATMELAKHPTTSVDFTDMIYVPLHNPTTQGEYDVVIVDEAQDMNAAQLHLAQMVLKKDGRLIVVGDEHQAIYGFRGADSGSMNRLQEKFKATVLPLPVTYRCAKAIVAEANRFVPDLQAGPNAPEGDVQYIGYGRMVKEAKPGDFILSRLNAPLLRLCLMFIKDGRRAIVEGRDIAKGLLNLISKMTFNKPVPVYQFLSALKVWKFKQIEAAQAQDDQEREQLVADQVEALTILSEDCESMDAVKAHIDRLFDDSNGRTDRIVCSTVHKAKGLEADRVFILCDTFKGGWEGGEGEEANLKYVAITRAKNVLSYVDHPAQPQLKTQQVEPDTQVHSDSGKDPEDVPF